MASPVIFLSAATVDLKTWRDHLHQAFSRAGFRVLTQDHSLKAAPGDVKRLLTETIEEADCVIHLAGMGYGSHATDPFPAAPGFQCSWTQFEYYHAHEKKKDVIAFVCALNLSATFVEKSTDPADLALKQRLQQEHRDRVARGHFAGTPLEGIIGRTSNESAESAGKLLESVAAAIGTLRTVDRDSRDKAQQELRAIASGLAVVNRKLIAALVLLGLIGLGVWLVRRDTGSLRSDVSSIKQDTAEMKKEVTEVRNIFAKERKFMALILSRANERLKDWENMTPAQRFDLALDQIAREQKMETKELRDLLDLYVQRVDADPDAEAEDKYYVLMRKQAFEQAASLASTEGAKAEERMKRQNSRLNAAKAVMEQAAKAKEEDRRAAVGFYQKEGTAQTSAVHYDKALAAYQKAAALVDETVDSLAWADAQEWVASVLYELARYKESEPLMQEIVRIREEKLGPDAPKLATALNTLATLFQATNRLGEAEPLMRRALKIDETSYSPDHPEVATDLNNLATLLQYTNRLSEAEPLMRRSLKIVEASYGPDHPYVATVLNNLAGLYYRLNRLSEAEPLYRRTLKMDEASYGPDHPMVAIGLNNLARLLQATNRLGEAAPLSRRHLGIFILFRHSTGHEHPHFKTAAKNYLGILSALHMSEAGQRAKLESLAGELGMEKAEVMGWFGDLLPGGK